MSDSTYVAAFYTSVPASSVPGRLVLGLDRAGVDMRATEPSEPIGPSSADEYQFEVPFHESRFIVKYTTDDDRNPAEPAVRLTALTHSVHPKWSDDVDEYQRRMDDVLELLSRLAMELEAEYVALIDAQEHGTDATPSGDSIPETVSIPPPIGIYSTMVLDEFGGPTELAETPPWYTAELADGRTVVVTIEEPWADGGWRPPMEAPYLEQAHSC